LRRKSSQTGIHENIRRVIMLTLWPALVFAEAPQGDITFTLQNAGPVLFNHTYHTKTRGVKCVACHFQTFAASGNSFQMNRRKITKRDFCEHCHNGLKGFAAKSEMNCTRCHKK
jgi:c(7)-type cytochrome triheme protein